MTAAAASLVALGLLGVPAQAGSSFSRAEVAADSDVSLTLTITEPEDEAYGNTAKVTVNAPSTFTVVSCSPEPPAWECGHDPETGRVTFSRTVLGALGDNTLQFTVHTSPVNGTYAFTVAQADGAAEGEEPTTVGSRPAVTVTGGQQPPADDGGTSGGSGSDTTSDSGGSTGSAGDPAGDGGSGSGGDGGSGGDSTDTSSDSTGGNNASSADGDGASGGGDRTAPRRTEGRAPGTTLEVTPRQAQQDEPTLDAPAVADEPAVAPPGSSTGIRDQDEAATTVAAGGPTDGSPAGAEGLPWQQVLGGTLLVAGGAVVAARRWDVVGRLRGGGVVARLRGWDPLARIRRWRSS